MMNLVVILAFDGMAIMKYAYVVMDRSQSVVIHSVMPRAAMFMQAVRTQREGHRGRRGSARP